MRETGRDDLIVQSANAQDSKTVAKLIGAWLFVGIPLVWAVWQVFVKSLALFKS